MPEPPPTPDSGKREDGRHVSGRRLAEHTYVQRVNDPAVNVELRYTPGRGRTIDWDGERYLPEALTKELGGFYAHAIPMVVGLALALGCIAGHYWL